jgi:glutathione S-transferase
MPHWTALVTVFAIALYYWMGWNVGMARRQFSLKAPAISGNPDFERIFRVQANTLEWLPIFLPSLWLFASYVGDIYAAGLGVVWIAGRVIYMRGYAQAADGRHIGFGIQMLAATVLMIGDLIAIVLRLVK